MSMSSSAMSALSEVLAAKMSAPPPEPVLQQTPVVAAPETAPPITPPDPAPTEPSQAQAAAPVEVEEDDYEFDPESLPAEAKPDEAAQPQQAASPEKDGYLDIDKEVLGQILKLPRGKEMYRDFKTARDLAKPLEDGGIGFKPDARQYRQFYEDSVVLQQMRGGLSSGDPQEVAKFFDHWLGRDPQTGQPYIPGAEQALQSVPQVIAQQHPELLPQLAQTTIQALQRSNPDALQATIIDPASNHLQRQFYALSQQTGDPAQKEWLKAVGDSLEWLRTGQAPGSQPSTNTNGAPRNGENPEVARLKAELAAVTQRINQSQQTQQQTGIDTFITELKAKSDTILNADIDNALAKVKTLNLNPIVFNGIKEQYKREVIQHLDSNSVALDLLNKKAQQAARSGNRTQMDQIAKEYRTLYSVPLTSLRTKYITAAGVEFKAKADAINANLQRTQKPGANGGVAAAVSASQNGRAERLPGETNRSYMERILSSQMQGV